MDQSNLSKNLVELNNRSKPKTAEGRNKKKILMKVYMLFIKTKNSFLMLSKVEYSQHLEKNSKY